MKKNSTKKKVVRARAPKVKIVKPKQKRVVRPRASKPIFKVVAEVNEQAFEATGATALEAMHNLQVPPFVFKTKLWLRLFSKDKQSEQMFLAIQFRRFTNSRVAREIWAKRLEERLS